MGIVDKLKSFNLSVGRATRRTKGKLYSGITSVSGYKLYVPSHLAIAPQDLRTADPLIAQEFYAGKYTLGGETVYSNGLSPFFVETATQNWKRELHSFTWLLHFSANKDTLSDTHARALVRDWIELKPEHECKWMWEIETTSRRLISFLCHSIVILGKPDHEFHTLFMRSLGKHVKILRRLIVDAPDGTPFLLAHIALAYASICFSGNPTSLDMCRERLGMILNDQILPDGGHASRNPAVIPEVLALLLPLKEGFAAIDVAPPVQLIEAVERMLPALRFFRHGDGALARFNGTSVTETDLVTTLLRYDETRGQPLSDAVHSGYQRAFRGEGLLLMDTGEPPKGELSVKAGAGLLSFEFSSRLSPIIVNCGTPFSFDEEISQVWRTSNAHSLAIINDTSSARFENPGTSGRPISGQLFSKNVKLELSREDTGDATTITAAHSAHVPEFGIRHQRSVTLDQNGERLYGQEWFSGPDKSDMRYTTKDNVALRFHLHPNIKASLAKNGETCLLETREGDQWRFDCPGFTVELAESIFFAALPSPRTTWQMIIHAKAYDNPEINWALQKIKAK